MKQLSLFVLCAAAFMLSPQVMAEAAKVDEETGVSNSVINAALVRYYDHELFQWNYSIFGGITLNFQNQNSAALFGVNNTMKEALSRYPDVHKEFESYRKKTIAGNILMWGGLAAVIASPMLPAFGAFDNSENALKIALGIMLSGLVVELTGVTILASGQTNIYHAVNRYNRHRIADFKQE